MSRLLLVPTFLLLGASCETPVATEVGCEVELATRASLDGQGNAVIEVWVTSFFERRTLSIPDCVGVVIDGAPVLACGPDGEPDLSVCEPATFELRGDTSVQVATIERPLAGDACNEPLEPGLYDVTVIGIDTGDFNVCRLYDILQVPE